MDARTQVGMEPVEVERNPGARSVNYTVVGFNGPSARRIEMLVDDDSLVEALALADKLAACGYVDVTVTTPAGKTYPLDELRQAKVT